MAVTTESLPPPPPTSDVYLKAELDRLGNTGRWLCTLFVITALPNIMTGYHMNSYVFVGEMPADYWCEGSALHSSGWTMAQRRQISAPIWRTSAQMAVSTGKAIGAIGTGILSDRFGRRSMYVAGACVYTVSSVLMTASPWYWGFLLGRFMVGLASSMIFYPSAVMMAENVAPKHRFWLTMLMHYVYPVGMVYLAGAAYWLRNWRELQLALTVPAVFLLGNIFFFHESPRWLISKGRLGEAHRILFGPTATNLDVNISHGNSIKNTVPTVAKRPTGVLHVVSTLYGRSEHRRVILICHFIYMTASFSYYVSVINSANLAANPTVYVLGTALVDSIADTLNLLVLRNVGRRYNLSASLAGAALSYAALMFIPTSASIPHSSTFSLLALAMIARMCICSAYSIIELYVVELFPTEVRSSALGFCSTLAHCASVGAPFVVDFVGRIAWHLPTTMCAGLLFVAAGLVLMSPETSKTDLEDFAADEKDGHDEAEITSTRL